jgi:hypothetical protein
MWFGYHNHFSTIPATTVVTNSCFIPLLFVIGRDPNGRILEKAPHHSVPVPDPVPAACHMRT